MNTERWSALVMVNEISSVWMLVCLNGGERGNRFHHSIVQRGGLGAVWSAT
jgi:hypothetical protein